MNTEQRTEPGSESARLALASHPADAISLDDIDFDDQLRATPLQIARWCAGWLVLGLGGWGAVITLGRLASDGLSILGR